MKLYKNIVTYGLLWNIMKKLIVVLIISGEPTWRPAVKIA